MTIFSVFLSCTVMCLCVSKCGFVMDNVWFCSAIFYCLTSVLVALIINEMRNIQCCCHAVVAFGVLVHHENFLNLKSENILRYI